MFPDTQMMLALFSGRCLYAHWHRPAAVDGLSGHGSLLCVRGALLSSAQVVSPGPGAPLESRQAPLYVLTAGGVTQPASLFSFPVI